MRIAVNPRIAFLERPRLGRLLARSPLFSPSLYLLPFPQSPVYLSPTWHNRSSEEISRSAASSSFFLRRAKQLGIHHLDLSTIQSFGRLSTSDLISRAE